MKKNIITIFWDDSIGNTQITETDYFKDLHIIERMDIQKDLFNYLKDLSKKNDKSFHNYYIKLVKNTEVKNDKFNHEKI